MNTGTAAITDYTVTDNLGGYTVGANTVYPLAYNAGTVRYYINGVLQTAPTVTAGPPLTVTGLTVPAGGSAVLIYETTATPVAPLATGSSITNTGDDHRRRSHKPDHRAGDGGDREQRRALHQQGALADDRYGKRPDHLHVRHFQHRQHRSDGDGNVVVTDTFAPILRNIAVTYNGTAWTEGTNYTYNAATGVFTTLAGQITVPAASFTQNTDGTFTVTPGTATLVITGTV